MMDLFNPFSSTLLFSFAFPILSLYFVSQTASSTQHKRILQLWVLNVFLLCTPTILGFSGFFSHYHEYRYLPVTIFTLSGPLLVAYFFTLTKSTLPTTLKYMYLLPLLELCYRLVLFVPTMDSKRAWLERWHHPYIDNLLTMLGCVSLAMAAVWVWRASRRYLCKLQEVSSQAYLYSSRLVTLVCVSVTALSIAWWLADTYELFGGILNHKQEYPLYLGLVIHAYLLIQVSIALGDLPSLPSTSTQSTQNSEKQTNPALIQALTTQQLYLQPRLNLSVAAEALGCTTAQLTQSIRVAGYENFNFCINAFRVDHAKMLLAKRNTDVLELGFESGFNSKASFNRAFKLHTGISPTQYRTAHVR